MTKIGLDIKNIKENIDNYRFYEEKLKANIDSYNSIVLNLENAWNDNNSKKFKKLVSNDQKKVKNYFKYLNKYYDQLDIFCDNISRLLSKYGCSSNAKINYDSSKIQKCINYIANAIGDINTAINYIGDIEYPNDFKDKQLIENMITELHSMTSELYKYECNICNLSNDFLQELREAYERKSKIGSFDGEFLVHEYVWSNVKLEPNNIKKIVIDTMSEVEPNMGKVSMDSKINNISFSSDISLNSKETDKVSSNSEEKNILFSSDVTLNSKEADKVSSNSEEKNILFSSDISLNSKEADKVSSNSEEKNILFSSDMTLNGKELDTISTDLKSENLTNLDSFETSQIDNTNNNVKADLDETVFSTGEYSVNSNLETSNFNDF